MSNLNQLAIESCINTLATLGFEIEQTESSAICDSAVHIQIEFFGDIKGYVILETSNEMALLIANKLLNGMMVVTEIDDMTKSVLSEVCNMVSGNIATAMSTLGYTSDIKPPVLTVVDKPLPAEKGTTLKYIADGHIINAYFIQVG